MKITAKHILNIVFIIVLISDVVLAYMKFIRKDNIPTTSFMVILFITVTVALIIITTDKKRRE